jgi:DNA-directed RNA polymerase subunit RPC12/RpoP
MAVPENNYIVLRDTTARKERGQRWLDTLKQWLVQCPQCSEVRLVVGARENDRYVCKDCGHKFTIKFSARKNDEQSKRTREEY